MTFGECLCSGEYAEISSVDNTLGALSNDSTLPEFRKYECRVLMFIRQQIKSRENEFHCDQSCNTVKENDTQLMDLGCDISTNSTHSCECEQATLLSSSRITIILITLMVLLILGLSYINRDLFCIPITLDKSISSKFF